METLLQNASRKHISRVFLLLLDDQMYGITHFINGSSPILSHIILLLENQKTCQKEWMHARNAVMREVADMSIIAASVLWLVANAMMYPDVTDTLPLVRQEANRAISIASTFCNSRQECLSYRRWINDAVVEITTEATGKTE